MFGRNKVIVEGARRFPDIIKKDNRTGEPAKPIIEEKLLGKRFVRKDQIVNKLNYINFQDGTVHIHLRQNKYDRVVSLSARPLPCLGNSLYCIWTEPAALPQQLESFRFEYLLIPDEERLITVTSDSIKITDKGVRLRLSDAGQESRIRRVLRHKCFRIGAQMLQNGAVIQGTLIDFNAYSFRVAVEPETSQTFRWVNSKVPLNLMLSDASETLYSATCKILRQTSGHQKKTVVLAPEGNEINRFKPKKYRSMRQGLEPQPSILFKHPLTAKIIALKISDLSGSGFSVEEDSRHALLLPGMIIPELELTFGNSFKARCKAQVIYQRVMEDESGQDCLRCGLAILDMEINEHVKLLALLQQATDDKSYICNVVDMNDLWNFFFETGFIYPQKYAFLEKKKERIKKLYEKLYTQHPSIARHFIYQKHGRILGHMAMFRFYEYNWLIHHYAASVSGSSRAGLMVLNQIGRFINDSHRLPSLHMDYVSCFYRPENKFPSRVFGGIQRNINDPKGCSLDTFAYFHYAKEFHNYLDLWRPWELTRVENEDLKDLEAFYEYQSHGLMLKAFDLEPGLTDNSMCSQEFLKIGLKREKHLFALNYNNRLKAIILVDLSDIGFNLSDLTNSIKVIVVDPEDISRKILDQTLSLLLSQFDQCAMAILLYPATFAEAAGIPFEKQYSLWVLSMQYTDAYFRYLERMLRFIQH